MATDVSYSILLALLNEAWNKAAEQVNSLRVQITVEQSAALAFVKKGSLSNVSKNSSSQGYTGYGPGRLTQVQLVEAWGSLLSAYDSLKRRITDEIEAADIDIPADFDYDAPIYELLTRAYEDADGFSTLPDIRDLRFPTPLPASNTVAPFG